MNIHDLREAQVHFESQINSVVEQNQHLYNLRDSFTSYYTDQRINQMSLEHYAIGNDLPTQGYNFCYTIERELDRLGRITGVPASRFGIYYGKTESDQTNKYRFTKKFGNTVDEAFNNVKRSLLELIQAGRNENVDAIIDNPISPMFKGKILSIYFPERYLNIFSDDHLKYFLIQLNLDTDQLIRSNPVKKREALVNFKNQDDVMNHWSLDVFMHFLYNIYPGRPVSSQQETNNSDPLDDYRNPNFPLEIEPEWVDLSIIEPSQPESKSSKRKNKNTSNPDYEKEARRNKKLGDRGEKIVLDMERQRLRKAGKPDLAKKVKKAKYDYMGYDIKSYETNGKPRYIEVKATQSRIGTANFFLSANELKKAEKTSNYYIYMVYSILSEKPKVWIIPNPFNPYNKKVVKTPISYRIVINAKLDK